MFCKWVLPIDRIPLPVSKAKAPFDDLWVLGNMNAIGNKRSRPALRFLAFSAP